MSFWAPRILDPKTDKYRALVKMDLASPLAKTGSSAPKYDTVL